MSSILHIQPHVMISRKLYRGRNMSFLCRINHKFRIITLGAWRRSIGARIARVVCVLETPDKARVGVHKLLPPVDWEQRRTSFRVIVGRAAGTDSAGWDVVNELAIDGPVEAGPFLCRGPVGVAGEGLAGVVW